MKDNEPKAADTDKAREMASHLRRIALIKGVCHKDFNLLDVATFIESQRAETEEKDREIAKHRKSVNAAYDYNQQAINCPYCQNQGWYILGNPADPEQCQCEFCHVEENSVFNVLARMRLNNEQLQARVKELEDLCGKILDDCRRADGRPCPVEFYRRTLAELINQPGEKE